MDIFETILKRRSVRAYQDKEISQADLKKILESARMSPSSFNSQPFKIIVVREPKLKEELAKLSRSPFIAKAPVILAVANIMLENKYSVQDVAIALDHIMLSATALGIGSVYIGVYQNKEVHKFLGAPKSSEMVALMPLGYPADREIPKRRKSLDELVGYEKF